MKTGASVIICLFLMLNITSKRVFCQEFKIKSDINTSSITNSNQQTPFWIWANQMGQIPQSSKFIQTGEINLELTNQFKNQNTIFVAGRAFGLKGEESHFEFTELFAGIKLGKIVAQLGSRADQLIQSGLSSSNGNLLNSRNARPYPSISLASDGFIQVGKRDFFVSGKWEEAILFDERIIDKPRLHHKNIFFRVGEVKKFQLEFGIDHYVFWGGTSAVSGPQPDGFTDYLRAILAMKGGAQHNLGDQKNVSGNSLGQYFFIFRKDYEKVKAEVRIVHPFEDKSGMVMFNTIDNLYSLYLTFKENKFLQHTLFELIYTKNQSGDDIQDGVYIHTNGRDNYLTHSFYNSGFTYFGNVMGSPLFYPVNYNSEGISTGVINNRIVAFHVGADGYLSDALMWKLFLTNSLNYGTHWHAFDQSRKQFSALAEFNYMLKRIPVYFKGSFAIDYGSNLNSGIEKLSGGARLTVGWYLL